MIYVTRRRMPLIYHKMYERGRGRGGGVVGGGGRGRGGGVRGRGGGEGQDEGKEREREKEGGMSCRDLDVYEHCLIIFSVNAVYLYTGTKNCYKIVSYG